MRTRKYTYSKITCYLGLILFTIIGCERELSGDEIPATYSSLAEIFTDAPVGLTDSFFTSFDPAEGANTEGFGTDDKEAYLGTSSIKISVPAPTDPNGSFIGGIFRDRGQGRDLSGYDALTFWAKGSTAGIIGDVGFGTDFLEGKFPVTRSAIQLTTGWKKYTIPIPNPSKLTQEKGMFLFSAGSYDILKNDDASDVSTFEDNLAWTFWIDEIKFEKLGTNLGISSQMLNGQDQNLDGFTGSTKELSNFSQVVNLGNGEKVTLTVAPSYFDFTSSDITAALVDSQGLVTVVGTAGTSLITASLNNNLVTGSLSVKSNGEVPHAPVPTALAANVVSLFSDAYTNVPVRHYNGFFTFATTQGGAGSDPKNVDIKDEFPNGMIDNIISYTALNFVSIGTYETVALVDISAMTDLHIDINIREAIDNGDFIKISLESGTGAGSTTAGDITINAAQLRTANSDGWLSLDIPLSDFSGFTDTSKLGQLFFVSDATVSDIWVDNVYFYKQ